MGSLNWTLQQIDLTANTLKSRINTETLLYTNPKAVLNKIEVIIATIPEEDIKYKIPKREITLGHILYMDKDDHKIICEWGNSNYLVLVAHSVKII